LIDAIKLKNQLTYDPTTGVFKWKESGKGRRKSLIAGCIKKKRGGLNVWRRIVFDGVEYTSGQLAWVLMNGEFPPFIIDHIDGDPLNDKWENLRPGNNCVDQRNQRKSIRNTSGVVGVKWHASSSKYHVYIGAGGVQKYLGCTDDFFQAVCIRKKAEIKYNYSYRHGV